MVKLTAKQEKFVQGLISGLSQRKAYIEAGYATKGKTDNYIDVEASRLFKNPKVSQRYQELLDEHKEKSLWTREEAVHHLKWLADKAMNSIDNFDEGYVRKGTADALLGAIQELNKLELLYPLDQLHAKKLEKEIEGDESQDDKLTSLISSVQKAVLDDTD